MMDLEKGKQTHELDNKVLLMMSWTWDDNEYTWQSRARAAK